MREKLFSVTKDDLVIQTFRAGGSGGQHQNKKDTGVRIIHPESGARGEARDSRSQAENKRKAFQRMLEDPKWHVWFNRKKWEAIRQADFKKSIEEAVEATMHPDNLRVEVKRDGKWVCEDIASE